MSKVKRSKFSGARYICSVYSNCPEIFGVSSLQCAWVSLKARAWRSWVAPGCDAASIGCSIPWCSAKPGAARALAGRAKEVLFPVPDGHDVYGFGCEVLAKGDSMIIEEKNKEIPDKRSRSLASDGIKRFNRVISDGQVGKGCKSAGYGRGKIPGDQVPLRAVNRNGGNPGHGFRELKRVAAFKGRRGCG